MHAEEESVAAPEILAGQSGALGETPWYLRLLRDEGAAAQHLATILASSRYAVELFVRAPESVAMLGESSSDEPGPHQLRPRALADLTAELLTAVRRYDDPAQAAATARGLRRRELLRIACADLLGLLDIGQVGQALSDVTAATLEAVLDAVVRDAEGKRGGLELQITPSSASDGLVAAYPLAATFPDDGCEPGEGFPVSADAPLAAFGGQSALQLVSAWRETLGARDLEGVWSDCSRAGVRVELELPASVCSRSASPGWSPLVSITAPHRISSTDGRLDVTVTSSRLEDGQLSLDRNGSDEPIPAAEFAARGGVIQ